MSADTPDLSVVIPCYKVARWLPTALESVFSQEGVSIEVIVIDDGSPDDIRDACDPFASRIKYIRQDNAGVAAARNRGIELARGRYLHCLDGDDWVSPGAYASMVDALERHPDWSVATCASRFVREDGSATSYVLLPLQTGKMFGPLSKTCAVLPSSIVMRRSILEKTGVYDTELTGAEDWDLLLRVARTGAVFGCVNRENYNYRQHRGSASRSPMKMYQMTVPVLERARKPDPRVTDPDPAFEAGADPADLPDRLAHYAAVGIGRALGRDQIDEACALLKLYIEHLDGSEAKESHMRALFWEAGISRGFIPPSHRETAQACRQSLKALAAAVKDCPAELEMTTTIDEALSGTTMANRVQELEKTSVYRSARWVWRKIRPYWPRRS